MAVLPESHRFYVRRAPACVLAWSVVLLGATAAAAQSDMSAAGLAAARDLFHEGIQCIDAGDLECAVDRLGRSLALRPSAVVAFNLAEAHQERGELVAAAERFRQAARLSEPGELRRAAEGAVESIVPRLARLRIERSGGGEVYLDGEQLEEALVGVFFAVDPGEHVAQLRNGPRRGEEARTRLAEGQDGTLLVELTPGVPTPEEVAQAAEQHVTLTPRERRERRRRRGVAVAIGIVAAGAIAALVGAVLVEPAYPRRTDADGQASPFR
ncbi:MAG: hypothetical protein AAF411_04155 [Myxococcota bacterium]